MNLPVPGRALFAAIATILLVGGVAGAAVPVVKISADPYSGGGSQHATEVEPDTFAAGSTIVSTFQVGRFFDGGSSNVGFSTSTNSGSSWTPGFLPGITKVVGGPYDRDTDPSVAYDKAHGVWIISTLAMTGPTPVAVLASRSTDGLTWSNPVTIGTGSFPDKNWTVCDSTPSSPFYGHCYTEWDDNGSGNRIRMSTSTDGGLTWGPPMSTADNATGIGGQPVVTKKGKVVVPIDNAFEGSVLYFTSTNGGTSWSATKLVSAISEHTVAGGLRTGPLPSAEIDKSDKVYVVWQDCRFRTSCAANDIVMATIKRNVSSVVRIPIDPVNSGIDHFIPGLAVDRSTGGKSAHLGLTYYYYPVSNCGTGCQLHVGFISSTDSGATWSAPTDIAGPITLTWLANTNQGRMVGDYISGSYSAGKVHSVFALANAPVGGVFDEAMYSTMAGLLGAVAAAGGDQVVTTKSDHPPLLTPATAH
jgi:hypothetical protein